MPPHPRSYDSAKVRAALRAQVEAVRRSAHALTAGQLAGATGLPGWTVHDLLVHIAWQVEVAPRVLAGESPGKADLSLSRWAMSTVTIAGRLDRYTRETAAETKDPAARLDAAAERLAAVLDEAVSERNVRIPLGAMRSADFLVTRLVELVVHSDDLTAATGVAVPLDRQALAAVARALADALAAKAPGRAVELRIPPFAAVQCVEGPRHTRGTPRGVVETDPLTWIRLATGRLTWADAVDGALLTASGERADLSALLPLLR